MLQVVHTFSLLLKNIKNSITSITEAKDLDKALILGEKCLLPPSVALGNDASFLFTAWITIVGMFYHNMHYYFHSINPIDTK